MDDSKPNPYDAPPPAYDSPEIWDSNSPTNLSPNYPTEKSASGNQPSPQLSPRLSHSRSPSLSKPLPPKPLPQDPPQQRTTHLLHIYRPSLFSPDLTILDSDKSTHLYTILANHGTLFSSKPHMRIYRGNVPQSVTEPQSDPVGTVSFHTYSRSIDLTLHKRSIIMENTSMLGYTHEFDSGIGPLKWKSDGWSTDMVLVTKDKEWIAKFHGCTFGVEKRGKLEIVNWDIEGVGLDEIVISGVAMQEFMRRQRRNS